MAETQDLRESQIVEEGSGNADTTVGTDEAVSVDSQPSAELPKRPRARRSTVKHVEIRTEELLQRVAELTDLVEQLSRRIDRLEANHEKADESANHNGAESGLAEHVRQLDERLQKLADFLTQQNWVIGQR
jgi:predicted RNase H-like nuclease (RuvC/YqgF family)